MPRRRDCSTVLCGTYPRSARRWSVDAFVSNVFDTHYYTSAQRGNETLLRYAGMPRTFGLELGFSFR